MFKIEIKNNPFSADKINRAKDIITMDMNEDWYDIEELIKREWHARAPIFSGTYSKPNEFGSPKGRGGTLNKSVEDSNAFLTDVYKYSAYSVEYIKLNTLSNRLNWYEDYDYAEKYYPLLHSIISDTLFASEDNFASYIERDLKEAGIR